MTRDLLANLQERIESQPGDAGDIESESCVIEFENNNKTSALDGFKLRVEQIDAGIAQIKEHTERVKDIHAIILSAADNTDKNDELEDIMASIKRLASKTRSTLKEIQAEAEKCEKNDPESAVTRMRNVQERSLRQMFVDAMTAYNNEQMAYRDKCKSRILRQLAITGKNTTDDELDEMLAGNFDVFTQNIIAETAKSKQALEDVNARHKDIMKLEASIIELRDLFIEMANLVESQGALIDRIEYNVQNTADYVVKAKEETKIAQEYQQKAMKKKIWLIGIALFILLIILIWIII